MNFPPVAASLLAGAFGLIFGSFLNVCISRLPQGKSIVKPRSFCPQCSTPIAWYDNIPVLSYLLLRGRCRACGKSISAMYPTVEVLTALLWMAAWHQQGATPEFLKLVTFGMLMIVLFFTDLNERKIPHKVTIFGIVAGITFSLLVPLDDPFSSWLFDRLGMDVNTPAASLAASLAGAVFGGGLLYAVAKAFQFFGNRDKEYLGFGDVMMMMLTGVFLGLPLTYVTLLMGSLLGTLVAVPLTLARPKFREYQWPYGCFLGAGALFASFEGARLMEQYVQWMHLN